MITQKSKLNLGSGSKRIDDYLNIDIRPEVNPDIVADLRNIPLESGTAEEIRLISVLEHFSKREVGKVLSECHRLLRKGGLLVISVPNMVNMAKELLSAYNGESKLNTEQVINIIYGENDYPENCHKWGFTPRTIKKALIEAGFENADDSLISKDLVCESDYNKRYLGEMLIKIIK